MNATRGVLMACLAASVAINALLAWRGARQDLRGEVQLASPEQVEVIRTPGGLLQVSTIRSPETFQADADHAFLGIPLGHTTTQIRIPAIFNYHVQLATEWQVTLRQNELVVIAPPIQPTLPVAIDTQHLERFSSGAWSLFTGPAELDALQRSITRTLATKAGSASYIAFEREAARSTVREFVSKWVVEQSRFRDGRKPTIHVFFADEPIDAISRIAPVYLATPGKQSD